MSDRLIPGGGTIEEGGDADAETYLDLAGLTSEGDDE
jgi:hypothetical protein